MAYQKFILLSHLRSGTHMLRSALESHPGIICQTEVFNSDNPNLPYSLATSSEHILQEWVFKPHDKAIEAVGFVLQSYHPWGLAAFSGIRENLRWGNIWSLLAKMPDIRVIHLKRRNLLARHLSHLSARASGHWHTWDKQKVHKITHLQTPLGDGDEAWLRQKNSPIALDAQRLAIDFSDIESTRARAERDLAGHPILEVIYEDLCHDFSTQCARIIDFLGCTMQPLATATKKIEQLPLSERISNYQSLQSHF